MKVAVLPGPGIPNPTAGGGVLTTWTISRYLLELGHEVVVVPQLRGPYFDPTGVTVEERIAALRAVGAEVVPLTVPLPDPGRARSRLDPSDESLFPSLADRGAIRETLEALRPDAVFAYHWEALAAMHGVHVAPKVGVAVDLAHLPSLYRWRAGFAKRPARYLRSLPGLLATLRRQPDLMVSFLNDCQAAGDFAAHHAEWLRRKGAHDCQYLRTPIPDPVGDRWREGRDSRRSDRPRFLLIGHLRGIATLEGLTLFTDHVLPRLERHFGVDGFDIRVVGGYEPSSELVRAFDHPAVTLCGHSDDPAEEFLAADALVVPTPIKLGTRVRILTAFSYACPVVAHPANALGIPELTDGDNVLLADDGKTFADALVRVAREQDLQRRLEQRGRETFEQLFAPNIAAQRIVDLLEAVASSPGR